MTIKLLINGIASAGKTSLLSSMGEETFVISRDAKAFNLPLPHMLVDSYVDMNTFIYGNEKAEIEGIVGKIGKYHDHFGKYPQNVVIDSVSQITLDVIETAANSPDSYGSRSMEINRELGLLTKFIHEDLELSGMNVILMNHVIEEKSDGVLTGNLLPFGQGKFLSKGAFFATTNEAISLVVDGTHRKVIHRGTNKQARTMVNALPDTAYVAQVDPDKKSKALKDGAEYFTLRSHIDMLMAAQADVGKWSF
jgi:hypothetical protein